MAALRRHRPAQPSPPPHTERADYNTSPAGKRVVLNASGKHVVLTTQGLPASNQRTFSRRQAAAARRGRKCARCRPLAHGAAHRV